MYPSQHSFTGLYRELALLGQVEVPHLMKALVNKNKCQTNTFSCVHQQPPFPSQVSDPGMEGVSTEACNCTCTYSYPGTVLGACRHQPVWPLPGSVKGLKWSNMVAYGLIACLHLLCVLWLEGRVFLSDKHTIIGLIEMLS